MVKKILKEEAGFTLVQTLAMLILISLLGIGLIILGFQVSQQVTVTQGISERKNQKNFVLQEAQLTLDSELKKIFSEENLKSHPLGKNDGVLRSLLTDFVHTNQDLNEGKLKKSGNLTYQNKISSFEIKPMAYSLAPGEGPEQGWEKVNLGTYNYQIVIPVESIITDNGKEIKSTSDYCYEIQWESKNEGQLVTETDIWGNMFYQVNRPSGIEVLSADTVMRKMANIYHFQDDSSDNLIDFPLGRSNERVINGELGIQEPYVVDVTDGSTVLNNNISELAFEGSFLLKNGFSLEGSRNGSELMTKNMLALTNTGEHAYSISDSRIENVSLDARTGLYLSLDASKDAKKITIDNNDGSQIETTNLVINQTIDSEDETVGTYLTNGQIQVSPTSNETVNFREYKGTSTTKNVQKNEWKQYQQGNAIISNSKVILAPSSGRGSQIDVNVANHFMLTNAGMSTDLTEDSFSYFIDEGREKIKQPSELILSGKETRFTVDGYSFLDAPKRNQRPPVGEDTGEKHIYITNQGLNKIQLKDSSQLILGFTGVEAFNFQSEKNSVFSMKVLPNLALFNPMFLEKGFKENNIQGKVVLETFNSKDTNALSTQLGEKGIPYKVVNNVDSTYANCQNQQVTIYENKSGISNNSYEVVTRNFSYMTDISY